MDYAILAGGAVVAPLAFLYLAEKWYKYNALPKAIKEYNNIAVAINDVNNEYELGMDRVQVLKYN